MRLGERVPNLIFQRPDGGAAPLRDFLDKPMLLIFLRRLA
jgi:hypothetical protein